MSPISLRICKLDLTDTIIKLLIDWLIDSDRHVTSWIIKRKRNCTPHSQTKLLRWSMEREYRVQHAQRQKFSLYLHVLTVARRTRKWLQKGVNLTWETQMSYISSDRFQIFHKHLTLCWLPAPIATFERHQNSTSSSSYAVHCHFQEMDVKLTATKKLNCGKFQPSEGRD